MTKELIKDFRKLPLREAIMVCRCGLTVSESNLGGVSKNGSLICNRCISHNAPDFLGGRKRRNKP